MLVGLHDMIGNKQCYFAATFNSFMGTPVNQEHRQIFCEANVKRNNRMKICCVGLHYT